MTGPCTMCTINITTTTYDDHLMHLSSRSCKLSSAGTKPAKKGKKWPTLVAFCTVVLDPAKTIQATAYRFGGSMRKDY